MFVELAVGAVSKVTKARSVGVAQRRLGIRASRVHVVEALVSPGLGGDVQTKHSLCAAETAVVFVIADCFVGRGARVEKLSGRDHGVGHPAVDAVGVVVVVPEIVVLHHRAPDVLWRIFVHGAVLVLQVGVEAILKIVHLGCDPCVVIVVVVWVAERQLAQVHFDLRFLLFDVEVAPLATRVRADKERFRDAARFALFLLYRFLLLILFAFTSAEKLSTPSPPMCRIFLPRRSGACC